MQEQSPNELMLVHSPAYICRSSADLLPRARMREAGLSNGFCPSVSHQNFGLITTTKGLNTSKRHSNNDNSEKTVHGVPEGG